MAVSTVAIYQFVARSLYANLDAQLVTLADAAAHNLPSILQGQASASPTPSSLPDDDGDLDLPWQQLQTVSQGLEWFDRQGQLHSRSGSEELNAPFDRDKSFQTWDDGEIRMLTVPVYRSAGEDPRQLLGYVRVSQLTEAEHEELERLLYSMGWGGVLAVALIGVTGWWLTQRSLRPIEQSVNRLRQFTADASHELRSPLTAIRTAVDVMQTHPERVDPVDLPKLNIIASTTQQMSQLVEDLLLLARSEASSSPGFSQELAIPIDELLDDLVQFLQPQAEARSLKLSIASLPEIQVSGDAEQLKRLFLNLLENALNYTPAGGAIEVNACLIHPQHTALIQIRDTGMGIAPEQLPYVFDRFWRADQARTQRTGGSGLGLAIAQAIAHSHGGTITVHSQLGIGSCFQVQLPLYSVRNP
ncbi:MAG: HAMP domain-containing sensor histidine kinase [Elainellaceae cyanobacterium]